MKRFTELTRFILGGSINSVVTYILYLAFIEFLPYRIAYTVTYLAGIFLGYWISLWVFRTTPSRRSAIAYPAVYLIQYVLGITLLSVLVEVLQADKRVAPLAVVALTFPVLFLLTRYVFSKRGIPSA